jgi:hypothetical protein
MDALDRRSVIRHRAQREGADRGVDRRRRELHPGCVPLHEFDVSPASGRGARLGCAEHPRTVVEAYEAALISDPRLDGPEVGPASAAEVEHGVT